jgi:8-oxo-dGTP pyrophosphatase MutT (NUDIX family)
MRRRIFNYDDMSKSKVVDNLNSKSKLFDNSISASGCLFYKIVDNKIKLLMIKYTDPRWPKLDDFGGKIDEPDKSVFDAAIRETTEETNNVISKDIILKILSDNDDYICFYNKTSKYYVYLMKVDDDFFNDTSIFGNFEKADKISRTVGWYDLHTNKKNIAYRIQSKELFAYLSKQIVVKQPKKNEIIIEYDDNDNDVVIHKKITTKNNTK